MLSNIIHLPGIDFTLNASLTKAQSLPEKIFLSETVCLPTNQPLIEHHNFCFTDKHILPKVSIGEIDDAPSTLCWAEIEFSHAELGDARRKQRLISAGRGKRGSGPR